MFSTVNFLATTPERMDDVARVAGGTMRAVERYEVLLFDVPS
jgi:hypothetical protein